MTFVISVRNEGVDWHVVALESPDGDGMSIAVDEGEQMLAFQSRAEAEVAAGIHDAPAIPTTYDELLNLAGPIIIDLDASMRWAMEGRASSVDVREIALAWDFLFAAGCAPPLMPFDPMTMYGMGTSDDPGAEQAVLVAGMKLSGLMSEADRKLGPGARVEWPSTAEFWSPDDARLTAETLRSGIEEFRRKLAGRAG